MEDKLAKRNFASMGFLSKAWEPVKKLTHPRFGTLYPVILVLSGLSVT
jgi:hypothetical protein